MPEPNDQRLWADLRAGRSEACAELVRGHYPAVYRFLVHLTRDVHQAEDLAQETFAAAWQQMASFQGRASLATWLHRIAYRKFIDAHRAEGRAATLFQRLYRLSWQRRNERPDRENDPSDAVMADDESRRLHRALDGLDAAERILLVLHYLQDLSYREMASVLDEPSGTVKWRTHEALNRLRILLDEKAPDHASRKIPERGSA